MIDSAGKEFSTVVSASTILSVTDKTKSPVTAGSEIKTVDASKRTTAVKITGNALANTISGGSKGDSIYGGKGNDSIVGNAGNDKLFGEAGNDILKGGAGNDSITGGAGNDSLTGGNGNDIFFYASGDGNDVITDYEENDKIQITSGTARVTVDGNDVILTVGRGSITVADGKDKIISYSDSDGEHSYSEQGGAGDVSISGVTAKLFSSYTENSFDLADYDENLTVIDASAVTQDLKIVGNELGNKITGGKGNDSLDGGSGKGNDTLYGGKGADTFIYYEGDGNDVIADYSAEDTIYIAQGTISSITKSGRDVVFKIGSGKLTVKNGVTVFAEKKEGITYIENNLEHYYPQVVSLSADGRSVTIDENYWKGKFDVADYGKSIRIIDASTVTRDIEILGNKWANSIISGEGDSTLIGGKGNDTLFGGDGKNIFVYAEGDGNDVIYNYAVGDKISITSGTVSNGSVKGESVVFTVGKGKINLEGAVGKLITVVDENGEAITKSYGTASSNVAWFLEDDNNFSTDNELSSLVESKDYLPPAHVDSDVDFVKENNFITYSKK